jgi:gamma-glutamyl-gamma-aminobutyrate hydrolase PuuD
MSKDKILILNGMSYGAAVKGLGQLCYSAEAFLRDPDDYKLVMFTGGEDVDPSLYGHTSPRKMCHYNRNRDDAEIKVFETALKNNIRMTGICRGSQLLNVLSGGVMMHHVEKHAGMSHSMVCGDTGNTVMVTSSHHQMSVPSDKGVIIGWSEHRRSSVYLGNEDIDQDYTGKEVEAICYPENGILAVQYHPEWMDENSDGYKWYYNAVKDLLTMDMRDIVVKYTSFENNQTMSAGS